eukprot:scaffold38528_cov22-Cyclotella_meneghiniana.AAC.1
MASDIFIPQEWLQSSTLKSLDIFGSVIAIEKTYLSNLSSNPIDSFYIMEATLEKALTRFGKPNDLIKFVDKVVLTDSDHPPRIRKIWCKMRDEVIHKYKNTDEDAFDTYLESIQDSVMVMFYFRMLRNHNAKLFSDNYPELVYNRFCDFFRYIPDMSGVDIDKLAIALFVRLGWSVLRDKFAQKFEVISNDRWNKMNELFERWSTLEKSVEDVQWDGCESPKSITPPGHRRFDDQSINQTNNNEGESSTLTLSNSLSKVSSNSRSNPMQAPLQALQAPTQSKAVSSGTVDKAPTQTKKTSNDNAKKDTKHAKKSSVGTIKQSKKSVSNAAKNVSHAKKLKADPSVKVKPGKLTSGQSNRKKKNKEMKITVPEVPEQVMPVAELTTLKPKELKGDKKNRLKSKKKEEQRLEAKRKRESLGEMEIDNRATQMKRFKALPPEPSSGSENELRDTDTSEDEEIQHPKKQNQRTILEDKSSDSESEVESEVESTSLPKGMKYIVAPPITMSIDETVNAPFFVALNSISPLYDIHAVMTKNKVLAPTFLFPYLLPNAEEKDKYVHWGVTWLNTSTGTTKAHVVVNQGQFKEVRNHLLHCLGVGPRRHGQKSDGILTKAQSDGGKFGGNIPRATRGDNNPRAVVSDEFPQTLYACAKYLYINRGPDTSNPQARLSC